MASTRGIGRRSKARGARRGAAMVETLMVVPVLITLLAAVHFFWVTYVCRLAAMEAARATAWSYAVTGCEGDVPPPQALAVDPLTGAPTDATAGGTNTITDLQDVGTQIQLSGKYESYVTNFAANFDSVVGCGTNTSTSTVQTQGMQPVLNIAPATMTPDSHVTCNDTPSDPDYWNQIIQNDIDQITNN
jgi:hypothetical protein